MTKQTKPTEKPAENQIDLLEVRLRILRMQKTDYVFLNNRYLAEKLNRHESNISHALSGRAPKLLARLTRHLDWLEARRSKKLSNAA